MRISLIAICVSLCVSSGSRAEVVYSNFGENESFGSGGYGVGDFTPPLINAVPFSVPYDTLVDEVRVPVAHTVVGSPNVLNVIIYSNGDDGNPGLPLESISLTDLPSSGFNIYSAFSSLRPRLEADKLYWVALSAKGQFIWGLNPLGRNGVTWSTDGGVTWQKRGFTNPRVTDRQTAFSVSGQVVPEPATSLLLSIAALAFVAAQRRREPLR
jgi:hypothetical protein